MPIVDKLILEDAISKLSPGYRSVFILHDIEGHEHGEVAEILGISEGTSKSQLHKARLKLRQLIREQASLN
jgi:RNA polymerase sigma-70 factor (ECF subfamily)